MLTQIQLRLFEPLTRNLIKEYTIKEIKEASGEKSNNAIALALKKFKDENMVKERRVGRSLLYTLNLDNEVIFSYIQMINTQKISKLALRAIERIKEEDSKQKNQNLLIFPLAV